MSHFDCQSDSFWLNPNGSAEKVLQLAAKNRIARIDRDGQLGTELAAVRLRDEQHHVVASWICGEDVVQALDPCLVEVARGNVQLELNRTRRLFREFKVSAS